MQSTKIGALSFHYVVFVQASITSEESDSAMIWLILRDWGEGGGVHQRAAFGHCAEEARRGVAGIEAQPRQRRGLVHLSSAGMGGN